MCSSETRREDFARALVDLYESEQLWDRVSKNGIEKTRALYSCEVAREQLSRLLSDGHYNNFMTLPRKRLSGGNRLCRLLRGMNSKTGVAEKPVSYAGLFGDGSWWSFCLLILALKFFPSRARSSPEVVSG